MATKHTQGEWFIHDDPIPIIRSRVPDAQFEGTAENFDIAEMCNEVPEEEMRANAKVIAEAPAMLKALMAAVKFIDLCPHLSEEMKPKGLDNWKETIKKATE